MTLPSSAAPCSPHASNTERPYTRPRPQIAIETGSRACCVISMRAINRRGAASCRAAAVGFAMLATALVVSPPVAGQTTVGAMPDSTAAVGQSEVSPASPRASLERYLELARAGRFAEAATYLDLPDSLRP